MSEPAKQPEVQDEQQEMGKRLAELLKEFDNAPSQEQIDAWKKQHGDVYMSGFSETELYLWRSVTRPEYVDIQTKLQDPNADFDQFKLEELICDTCVLWKSVDRAWNEGKAGTPHTLSEQIMQNSNFMTPQAASVMVAKL